MRYSCPGCDASLRLSDELKPGSRVRCPKCGEPFALPATKAAAARKANPDDAGTETRRPMRRRPKQKSGQGDLIMYGGLGLLALALVAGGVVLAVSLSRGPNPEVATAPPTPPPPAPQPAAERPVEPAPQPTVPQPATPTRPDANDVAVRPVPKDVTPPREVPRERPRDPGPLPEEGFDIGKLAPDIEGEDIDGRRFKLSDYRGKVVVLDFWGHW